MWPQEFSSHKVNSTAHKVIVHSVKVKKNKKEFFQKIFISKFKRTTSPKFCSTGTVHEFLQKFVPMFACIFLLLIMQ